MSKRARDGAEARKSSPHMAELYRMHTLRWWQAHTLVTKVAISTTHGVRAPAGTRVRVVGKRNGFTVETQACSRCGVRFRVARVPAVYFDIVEDTTGDAKR